MRLTATEEARVQVFAVAELARETRRRGLLLNAPEATALITDALHWAARAGASYPDVIAAGMGALKADDVLDGVADLVDEIHAEVLLEEGSRLIVLRNPIRGADQVTIGGVRVEDVGVTFYPNRRRITVTVRNTSDRVVRVSSHYPFAQVNACLAFDRERAGNSHLDVVPGELVRWGPGETLEVRLVERPRL